MFAIKDNARPALGWLKSFEFGNKWTKFENTIYFESEEILTEY